jgi:LEA14-like dessication related protein
MDKLSIFLLLTLFLCCTAVKERLALKECRFSLISVTPYDFTFANVKLDFTVKVNNPNKVDAVLDKLTYTFYVNETDVFSGTTGKDITIPANKAKAFPTTITLEYTKVGQALIEAIKINNAAYKLKARAYINTIIGEINYPVEIKLE